MPAPKASLPVSGNNPGRTTVSALERMIDAISQALFDQIGAIATGLEPAGNWDASSGAFPSGSTKGSYYVVSTAGTVDGQAFAVGDWLVPLVDAASTTNYAGQWFRADYSKVVPRDYTTVTDMTASLEPSRGTGSIWEAQGFRYEEVTSGEHLTTAGGVKLKVLPGEDGAYNVLAFGAVADGATDDWAAFNAALTKTSANSFVNAQTNGMPKIVVPHGDYVIGQSIQLQRSAHIKGESHGGSGGDNGSVLTFPLNSRGIVVNRSNTYDDTTVTDDPGAGADGSILEGLTLVSSHDNTTTTAHGVWLRARATVRDCHIKGFGGNGVNIYAEASGTGSITGNANLFSLDRIACTKNLRHGVFVRGADANAGSGYMVNCTSNGGWGILDASFLGNAWYACHASSNGVASGHSVAYTKYGGVWYIAGPDQANTEQDFVDTQPGTNATVWVRSDNVSVAAGDEVVWTAGLAVGTFRTGGSYASAGTNGKALFSGCYIEGAQGRAVMSQRAMWQGGFNEYDVLGPNVMGYQGIIRQTGTRFVPDDPALDVNEYTQVGASKGIGLQYVRDSRTIQLGGDDNRFYLGTSSASQQPFHITAADTVYQFSRGAAQPYAVLISKLFVGGTGANSAREITVASAAPTTGTWARGDRVFNSGPSVDVNNMILDHWTCTVGGTPGTWVPCYVSTVSPAT